MNIFPEERQSYTFSLLPQHGMCDPFNNTGGGFHPMPMAQEALLENIVLTKPIHEALYLCTACDHVVPRTVVCLYCGALIPKENQR
jgi:hypothetical protein